MRSAAVLAEAGSGKVRLRRLAPVLLAAVLAAGCASSARSTSSGGVCDTTTVAHKVLPSVVTILVSKGSTAVNGSGEVIRADGHILTNNHVVSGAANGATIQVLFSDGSVTTATITGRDPQTDIAVIKVSDTGGLKPIELGSSGSVKIGQPVVVFGAPLGLASTVTSGIVSALGRTVTVAEENGQSAVLLSAIQTDAAINPGNSGGSLTNCSGELIGMPSAAAAVTDESGQSSGGSIGLGFAIPVDLAKAISDELIAHGSVTHSYFGMEVVLVPAAKGSSEPEGLYVSAVAPGGPAAGAGLKVGDVITEVEGKPADDPTQLALLTLKKKPGETVTVTYLREGQSATATITLGTPP